MKPRKIHLECEHVVWLRSPLPHVGEEFYCTRCQTETRVGPVHTSPVIYPDYAWESSIAAGRGGKFHGACLVTDCEFTSRNTDWYRLRDTMEGHHLRAHTHSTLISQTRIEIVTRPLPKHSPPPF